MAKKKSKDLMNGLFDEVVKSVNGAGGHPMMKLQEMQDRYGIPGYCSTGYPSWDLHMMHSPDNSEWGFPYGRVTGIYGAQSALKTRTCYEILAENIKRGGHSFLLTYEMDFDESYATSFLRKRGIKEDIDDLPYGVKPILSMKELNDTVKSTLKKYKEVADKVEKSGDNPHEELPPIAIAVDSMGALLSHGDRQRLEGEVKGKSTDFEDGKQVGGKASEIHNFFQLHLLEFARLGVLFLYTNHYRDNIGYGNKKYNPAHDSALKYYPSLRLEMKRGYDKKFQKERSSMNVKYRKGWEFLVRIRKVRQELALSGEVAIRFYENLGLDYIGSLVDAAHMSGVAGLYAGAYTLEVDDDHELSEFNGKYTKKKLRKKIREDVKFRVLLEKECMKRGPQVVQEFD
jgi:RecA/RadA recombinase